MGRLVEGFAVEMDLISSDDTALRIEADLSLIYLLRHGDAEDGDGNDAARRLTAKGERQAKAAGEVARLTGANVKLRKGGLAIVDGSTLVALLRPKDLAAIAAGPTSR